jgi:CheY-like chemotaxis protein
MAHLSLLSKLREVSVIAASSVAEARAVIEQQMPKVVILDMQLPDGTGLDVVAALEARGAQSMLIVVSAHLEHFRPEIHPSERIHLLSKPAPMRELRQIVERVAQATELPGPFSVTDYVQLAGMGLHSVTIECVDPKVGARGEIVMHKGEPWSAQDEQGVGVPAFNRLVTTAGTHVRVVSDKQVLGPRNLTERWEHMVLEAMRIGDELRFNRKPARVHPDEAKARKAMPVALKGQVLRSRRSGPAGTGTTCSRSRGSPSSS